MSQLVFDYHNISSILPKSDNEILRIFEFHID